MPQPISHPGVYVRETPPAAHAIEGVATSVAVFVGRAPQGPLAAMAGPVRVCSLSDFEHAFGAVQEDWTLGLAVLDFFASGGHELWVLRLHAQPHAVIDSGMGPPLQEADYVGEADAGTGLHALDRIDAFNLLCIPPDVPGGDTAPEVWQAALAQCVRRRAMLLVDPPAAWDGAQALPDADALAKLGLQGAGARNAALYFPRLVQQGDDAASPSVPCGAVAGVFARFDHARGVWKAPVGLEAALPMLPAYEVDDEQQEYLNPIAINCIRTFAPRGTLVWGARTLAGADRLADDYKYVPVRRLALFIEDSLLRGLAWTAFEPNDEALWARVRHAAGAFMHRLLRQGALQGSAPRQAYFVRCDAATTHAADLDAGICCLEVGFAPLKPAEFLVLRLSLQAASREG